MNFSELLLQDFQNATIFEMYLMVFCMAFAGVIIFILLASIFKLDLNEHYRRGQIDAINGKIKFEKRENDDKEIVWWEIESIKNKH